MTEDITKNPPWSSGAPVTLDLQWAPSGYGFFGCWPLQRVCFLLGSSFCHFVVDKHEWQREPEIKLSGMVKWDGCSHINFGDGDGYMHLCGLGDYENLAELLKFCLQRCTELVNTPHGWGCAGIDQAFMLASHGQSRPWSESDAAKGLASA